MISCFEMQCVITAGNVKVFGKAIHSLAKIGTELYMEDSSAGLALRTVNSSRSGYASIVFLTVFFHIYDRGSSCAEDKPEEFVKCKIDMKVCYAIFKSLSTIEKAVEKCAIKVDSSATTVVFQLFFKYDIIKTCEIACIESESLRAVFSKEDCANNIVSSPRLLQGALQSFQPNQDEITLAVTSDMLYLRNYVDERLDPSKVLYTELQLEAEEFYEYSIQDDTSVTFSLKELRAALSFSEVTNEPVSVYFSGPGRPIVFTVQCPNVFEADFVLATLDVSAQDLEARSELSVANGCDAEHATQKAHDGQTSGCDPRSSTGTSRGTPAAASVRKASKTCRENDPSTPLHPECSLWSPPCKKSRSIFSVLSPQTPESAVHNVEVLASDTDDEG